MRFLLCDDNPIFINTLQEYILEFFKTNNIDLPEIVSYEAGEDLLADNGKCDFLFLDIEMPGINGIYTGQAMKKKYPYMLLFIVTSYSEYLDDAMRINVFRYLSKPLDKQRLFRNLRDGIINYNMNSKQIAIETKNEVSMVFINDIVMAKVNGRMTTIYTTHGTYESTQPMAYWINSLNFPSFFQSHRSCIVNFKYVTYFNHDTIVLLSGIYNAYLTKRKYTAFRKAHLTYIESTR